MRTLVVVAIVALGCGERSAPAVDVDAGGMGGAAGAAPDAGGAGGALDAGHPDTTPAMNCAKTGCALGYSCETDGHCEPRPVVSMPINVQNQCSADVQIRFFDPVDKMTIPDADSPPISLGGGLPWINSISCTKGAQVCYGVSSVGITPRMDWGLGLDGKGTCDSCCFACTDDPSMVPVLHLTCLQGQPGVH